MFVRKLAVVAMLLFPVAVVAQYTPSKAQHAKLAKQKAKVMKVQVELERLQSQIAFEMGELGRACREVALLNRWPSNVNCNAQSLTFSEPPPVPLSMQQQPAAPAPTSPVTPPEQKKP